MSLTFKLIDWAKLVTFPKVAGLIQLVEGLNPTRMLSFPKISGNTSFMTTLS